MLFYAQKMPKKDLFAHASQYCTYCRMIASQQQPANCPAVRWQIQRSSRTAVASLPPLAEREANLHGAAWPRFARHGSG
jgi:hypothetical protein